MSDDFIALLIAIVTVGFFLSAGGNK